MSKTNPSQFKRFKLSKPWGYYPPDVEKTIDRYELTIGQLNDKLSEEIQENTRLKDRIVKLEDELRSMHMEMAALELPDTEEIVESVVLDDFRHYPAGPMNAYNSSASYSDEDDVLESFIDDDMVNDLEEQKNNNDNDDLFHIVT